jgi:type VI secretion system ImpC/EvpB family protein
MNPASATNEDVPSTSPTGNGSVIGPGPPAPDARPTGERSLLARVFGRHEKSGAVSDGFWERFPKESHLLTALALFLREGGCRSPRPSRGEIARRLNRAIARVDELLNRQLNTILHHPRFQKLEASWRGLEYVLRQVPEEEAKTIQVKVLNLSWKELVRDLENATEFDQSQFFRKVYEDEFGMPGGQPYGMLIGDYQVRLRPGDGHPTDDVEALGRIAEVAAAAFAPFVAAAHPSLFQLRSFTDLERPFRLEETFAGLEYLKWRALREREDSRFLGLTLPGVLMRRPYSDSSGRVDGFRFREEVEDPDRGCYLWGNAAYALGAVVIRAFASCQWLAGIRGVERGVEGGGLVTGLPTHSFGTDRDGVAPKCSTEVIVTDAQEKELGDLGFIPLCHCQDTEWSAFYGNQSVQKPKVYDEPDKMMNARLSAMLQYILCASRVGHFLKVQGRDWVGSHVEAEDLKARLQRWINGYVNPLAQSEAARAQKPLAGALVEVEPDPRQPGKFRCGLLLKPHYQLDQMAVEVRLKTTLRAPGA